MTTSTNTETGEPKAPEKKAAPKSRAKAPAKKPAAAKKAAPASTARSRISKDSKLKVQRRDVSFREGSRRAQRVKALRDGMTVGTFLDKTKSKMRHVRFLIQEGIVTTQQ